MLRAVGVSNPVWLSIVLGHHERSDGSGYPHGRRDHQVDRLTSLVALADNDAAMVLPRAYRSGTHAHQAMREIFVQRRIRVAGELVQQFVRELGVYPPGAFVAMKNGDHGIVIKRGHHSASAPVVSCFANVHHVRFDAPLIRDTGEGGGHAIAAIAAPQALALPLSTIWGMGR